MAGIVRGSIEHWIVSSSVAGSQDGFVAILKQFDSDPNMTRIASFYGNGGALGFDYSFGPNPTGENGWAVWSKTAAAGTYYVHLQWCHNESHGAGGGAPADSPSNGGAFISMAYDTTGTSPWNGTVNNNGADTKGTPVWVANGGNLVVFPRGNGAGGTFATDKQAMAQAYGYSTSNNRLQILADDDYLWIGHDSSTGGSYERMLYMGPYTPATGVTPDLPLCMWQCAGAVSLDSNTGTTSNGSSSQEGGVTAVASSSEARSLRFSTNGDLYNVVLQPNPQRATPSYDALSIALYVYDAQGAGTYGLLGYIDGFSIVYNVPTNDTNPGLTKFYCGSNTQDSRKLVVDWDGATTPGTGVTIAGVQF